MSQDTAQIEEGRWNPRTLAFLALGGYVLTPCFPPLLFAAAPLHLAAIALGFAARKTRAGRDGLVIGLVALVLIVLFFLAATPWETTVAESSD